MLSFFFQTKTFRKFFQITVNIQNVQIALYLK